MTQITCDLINMWLLNNPVGQEKRLGIVSFYQIANNVTPKQVEHKFCALDYSYISEKISKYINKK